MKSGRYGYNFGLNLELPWTWAGLLGHVEVHGKFDFVICTHVIEDLSRWLFLSVVLQIGLSSRSPASLVDVSTASFSLLVTTPSGTKEFFLQDASLTFGRSLDNSLVIDQPVVSRHHARLERTPLGYRIEELE